VKVVASFSGAITRPGAGVDGVVASLVPFWRLWRSRWSDFALDGIQEGHGTILSVLDGVGY